MTSSPLADALRGWRNRLSPVDAGLPTGPGRRTAGLRREELAQLAGLSVDYLVRLEQGRALHPSSQVIAALSRSLQLDRAERDHLYRCAGLLPPSDAVVDTHVTPGISRLATRIGATPVAVFAADWTLLQWNPMWAAVLGDPKVVPYTQRNLVRAVFGDADALRASFRPVTSEHGFERFARALVADLRSAALVYPRDPTLAALIAELRESNPWFDQLFTSGTVAAHMSERKTIEHPDVGTVTLDCDVLNAPGSDLRLVVYTAASGSVDADKLDFLRVTAGIAS